jgi:hypothetical protein
MDLIVSFVAGTAFGGFVVLYVGQFMFNFFDGLEVSATDLTKG